MILKKCVLTASVGSLLSLSALSVYAADEDVTFSDDTPAVSESVAPLTESAQSAPLSESDPSSWVDMSDPTAIYSHASIGGGNQGVDFSATYGGYLSGVYKHSFTLAAREDLEHYETNYFILNSASNSGVAFDNSWSEDMRIDHTDYDDLNNNSIGFFAKLPFMEDKVRFHPKVSVGFIWGDDFSDTTYVKFDATTRYRFDHMYWVGITPTYAYGFKGEDLNEWTATLDAGVQISDVFGISASVNDDKDFLANVTFAF